MTLIARSLVWFGQLFEKPNFSPNGCNGLKDVKGQFHWNTELDGFVLFISVAIQSSESTLSWTISKYLYQIFSLCTVVRFVYWKYWSFTTIGLQTNLCCDFMCTDMTNVGYRLANFQVDEVIIESRQSLIESTTFLFNFTGLGWTFRNENICQIWKN